VLLDLEKEKRQKLIAVGSTTTGVFYTETPTESNQKIIQPASNSTLLLGYQVKNHQQKPLTESV